MPKPPLISSPRLRQLAVSVAMTLLLAMSLLLAMWFSGGVGRRPALHDQAKLGSVQVGPATFAIPVGWQPMKQPIAQGLGQAQMTLTHPDRPGDFLIVGLLPQSAMRSPEVAAKQAVALLLGDKPSVVTQNTRFRQGVRTGLMQSVMAPRKRPEADLAHLAVFTEQGDLYGMVALLQVDIHKPTRREIDMDVMAIAQVLEIAQRARLDAPPTASQADLARAGLAIDTPPADATLTLADDLGHDALVHLLPRGGPAPFWRARLHGVPNALTPGSLTPLHRQVLRPMQRRLSAQPEGQAPLVTLTQQTHGLEGWIIRANRSAEQVRQTDGLVREMWYILADDPDTRDSAPGQDPGQAAAPPLGAIVAELVAEASAHEQASNRLMALLAQWRATRHEPGDAWAAARQRGEQWGLALRQSYANAFTPHRHYHALYRQGQPMGFAIDQRQHTPNAPLPWRSRSLTYHAMTPVFIHQQSWSASDDATRWQATSRLAVRTGQSPGDHQVVLRHLTLQDHWLTLLAQPASPVTSADPAQATPPLSTSGVTSADASSAGVSWQERWRSAAPAAFLPWPLLDALPAASLEAWSQAPAALVWTQHGDHEPEPCWMSVQAVTGQAADALGFDARWLIRLRPMADVEDIQLWADEAGQVVRTAWGDALPAVQATPLRYTLQRTDRQRIVRAFAPLQADIETWEDQWAEPLP